MSLRHSTSIHSKQSAGCWCPVSADHCPANVPMTLEQLNSIFNIKRNMLRLLSFHPKSFGIITHRVPAQRNHHHHHHHRAYRLQCIYSPLVTIRFDGISCKNKLAQYCILCDYTSSCWKSLSTEVSNLVLPSRIDIIL